MARLVAAYDEQEKRTDAELVATVALLLAGNETTTNLIFNATLALCRFPERRRELRFDRPNAKHLGFGEWIHICLGQFLARMAVRLKRDDSAARAAARGHKQRILAGMGTNIDGEIAGTQQL